MEFSGNETMNTGSGSFSSGLLAGSVLNRRDDNQNQWVWAVIIFVIFIVLALVFLAFMKKDDRRELPPADYYRKDNNWGELITGMIAAKGMNNDCNGYGKYADHDHIEIKDQISHSEDRRMIEGVKAEVGSLGLFMQKTASDNEMKNLEQFGEIKKELGMLNMGLSQVLQTQNNEAIITGVINRLMCKPCA